MRNRPASVAVCAGLVVIGLVGGIEMRAQGQGAPAVQAPAPSAPMDTAVLRAQYEQWRTQFKTWGRWAPIGQESKGTTNLITPEKVASAMRLAKDGIVVSLAHAEPQTVAADVGAPGIFHRVTNAITDGGTTDNYQVSYHGQTIAHIDTWCHFFENGMMYNGVPVKDNLTSESGCIKGSVMNWKGGVTTRAVIYDIPQLKGVDVIDPSVQIRRADLEAWEVRSGVKIGPGDIPLLYTGRWKRRAAVGAWATPVAGYYPDTLPWMHERLPAFIGHDFNIDWNPRPGWEGMRNPIHVAVLNWMGINIVECLDLEEMIATARRLNRYEAVITFAPLPVEGGTGSPVNPLVTF
ncbi:MAG TPA: cyclase family protein [Xanthobacteraceae bacterium]